MYSTLCTKQAFDSIWIAFFPPTGTFLSYVPRGLTSSSESLSISSLSEAELGFKSKTSHTRLYAEHFFVQWKQISARVLEPADNQVCCNRCSLLSTKPITCLFYTLFSTLQYIVYVAENTQYDVGNCFLPLYSIKTTSSARLLLTDAAQCEQNI